MRRSDVFTSSPSLSPSPSATTDMKVLERPYLASLPELDFFTPIDDKNKETGIDYHHTSENDYDHEEGDKNDETFSFRLFSHSQPSQPASTQKRQNQVSRVSIRSPTPLSSQGEGGFTVPFRPRRYYFTSSNTDDEEASRKRVEYADVALTGEEVISTARRTVWVRASTLLFLSLLRPVGACLLD